VPLLYIYLSIIIKGMWHEFLITFPTTQFDCQSGGLVRRQHVLPTMRFGHGLLYDRLCAGDRGVSRQFDGSTQNQLLLWNVVSDFGVLLGGK
jgi:hypothetical protein